MNMFLSLTSCKRSQVKSHVEIEALVCRELEQDQNAGLAFFKLMVYHLPPTVASHLKDPFKGCERLC